MAHKVNDRKFNQLMALWREFGLNLKELKILSCALDGQMTEGEILREIDITQNELNRLVQDLTARHLIGRQNGVLIASIQDKSSYHRVA